MANMYHINGDSVSPCKAEKGQCPFGKGEENNHFSDAGEAMAVLEYRLSKEYDTAPSMKKADHDMDRGLAAARGMDTTEFDKRVAAGEDPKKVAAEAKPPSAKELAASGADAKMIREALRRENPTWDARRVHTVQAAMSKPGAGKPAPAKKSAPKPNPHALSSKDLADKLLDLERMGIEQKEISQDIARLRKEYDEYNRQNGAKEGRAYYYDYQRGGRIAGVNPNGNTYFEDMPAYVAKFKAEQDRLKASYKKEEDLQTAIEKSGNGDKLPDDGNTIRVRTQAQKWLLKNELQGQISDGMWENTMPHNHWEAWSSAKVIVDPKNPGRNFNAVKDNYQLNSKRLLDVVGDRMVSEAKEKMEEDYDEKRMLEDLADLRKIFKTKRGQHTV